MDSAQDSDEMEGDAFGAREQPFLLTARIPVHDVSWCRALRLTACTCLETCPRLFALNSKLFRNHEPERETANGL